MLWNVAFELAYIGLVLKVAVCDYVSVYMFFRKDAYKYINSSE